jgi:hypothetical protein
MRKVVGSREAARSAAPATRERRVDHVIDEVVVEQFGLVLNALSPETQPLGYGAALLVLGSAGDGYPVQAELPEGVVHQCPTRGGHEPLALGSLAELVAQGGAAVLPLDAVMTDHPH